MSDYQYTPDAMVRNKEEKLSWADIQYNAINKIFEARYQGDNGKFTRGVNALALLLSGHYDDEYKKELELAQHQKKIISESEGEDIANLLFFDSKMEALSNLMFRINKGIERIRNRWKGSQLAKEISHQLITGTGQNIFITGKPGSGKSLTGIALAREVTSITKAKFDIKTNVVFTPQQFLTVYNDTKLTPEGGCIIYDEAGVTYSSKETYQEANKMFSKLLQTIRHRSIMVIFTAPDLGFIAKDGRKLLHWWIETNKLNKKEKICTIKPFTVEISQRDGKILFPYPIFDGKQLVKVDVEKISDKDEKIYKKLSVAYKNDLALNTEITYGLMENTKLSQLKEFSKLRQQGKKISEACKEMDLHRNTGTSLEKMRLNTRVAQYAQDNA